MEILTRAARFAPSTFNAETGTLEAAISTGADVLRRDFAGEYVERLPIRADAWEAARSPVPVLRDHVRTTDSVVGGATNLRTADGAVIATIALSQRDDLAGFRRDLAAGFHSGLSIGFTVPRWIESTEGGRRVRTAERVVLHEVSFTPTPADAGAGVRSISIGEDQMQLAEQLRNIAGAVGVSDAFVDGLVTRNLNLEQARAEIIREAARAVPAIDNRQPATITRDAGDGLIARMADGLLARMNPAHRPTDGREFATATVGDIARRCLEARGLSTLGSRVELITRALHTTSDFPAVLQEAYNKELLRLNAAQSPLAQVFRRASVSDFRARHIVEISEGQALEKVNEKGEIKSGAVTDKELASYRIASYARGYGITFNVLVNDDLAALSDITAAAARGARTWFSAFLADTLIANPKLADNKAAFHADHGNLASSGAVPSEETIGAAKLAMRLQTDLSGNPINAEPKFIVAPAEIESTIDQLLAKLYPAQPSDAVVSARNLTPVIAPHFDVKGETTAWYLFADPAIAPAFEYAELEGYAGPQVEVRQGFETLGLEVRVVWHVGAGAIDSRGAFKNPGA